MDNIFKPSKVSIELKNVVRKIDAPVSDKDKTEEELKGMRIRSLRKQLNDDREALRKGKVKYDGREMELNTHMRNLLSSRIKRAINMLDREYGESPDFKDGFNEVLENHNKK